MTSRRLAPLLLSCLAIASLTACNDDPAGCEDLASYACYAEISAGCCTMEATPNAAICRGGRASCPAGLLARDLCAAFAGDGCEAASGVPGPGGVIGVCCPIADFVGCSPGETPIAGGGWAPSFAECQYFVAGTGGPPWMIRYEWGCPILREDVEAPACEGGDDAGPTDLDGGVGFDGGASDAGASDAGGSDAGATDAGGSDAGVADSGGGDAGAPADCSGATRVDAETCTVAGCVPTTAPIGAPPVSPECVAVTVHSCVVRCRRVAPPCPTGTTAEGDGFCYTDRCIPASVCAP